MNSSDITLTAAVSSDRLCFGVLNGEQHAASVASIAIRQISKNEGGVFQNFWDKLFWVPIEVKTADGTTPLFINIRSAIKNLGMFSKSGLKKALKQGSLVGVSSEFGL